MSNAQELVDIAYGPNADLYKDVLKVSRSASKDEIQSAFIDRRYELYELLQNASAKKNNSRASSNDNASVTSVSDRHFTEKKMDALVATFRVLYDPEKRLEYNATSNAKLSSKLGKSPTGVIPGPPPTGSREKSVPDEVKSVKSSPLNSSAQQKSNTRRQLFTKHDEKHTVLKTPNSAGTVKELPTIPSKRTKKRSSKRKSKTKQKKAYSPTLPKTKVELFRDEDDEHQEQPHHVNINSVSLRQTYEQITKQIEHSSQQPYREIDNNSIHTEQDEISYMGKNTPKADVRIEENDTVDSGLKIEQRSRSQVTWKDSEVDSHDDLGSIKEEFSVSEVHGGCLDLRIVEHSTDVDSNTLVGFLRSSGFENQAYLLQELKNEVKGSISDTILAVDQVLNAFKIADDDIDAVVGNIREERNCLAKHIAHES